MELLLAKPHTQDQSNKELVDDANNWVLELSISSNIRRLRSLYIKHNGTKFQMSTECFPGQFLHPNKRSTTFLSNTHWIPKDIKARGENKILFCTIFSFIYNKNNFFVIYLQTSTRGYFEECCRHWTWNTFNFSYMFSRKSLLIYLVLNEECTVCVAILLSIELLFYKY